MDPAGLDIETVLRIIPDLYFERSAFRRNVEIPFGNKYAISLALTDNDLFGDSKRFVGEQDDALTFILAVACFNIIGSLSMLIIDKKDDVVTLRNLGATDKQITRIFLLEGRLIAAVGAVVGIVLGLLLCLAQQTFGLVKLGSTSGSFIVDAYPVSVHPWDIVLVFFTVLVVSFLAVWYPVHYFSRRLING